jgi:putative monooxygenase
MAIDDPKAQGTAQIRARAEANADTRRGGDVRTLLSPKTVESTSGFMGMATIGPGDRISEHYHPYSEEFIYCVRGSIRAELDDEPRQVNADEALFIPINVKHRLVNDGTEEAMIVFHLSPLAPDPKLGHVDTE